MLCDPLPPLLHYLCAADLTLVCPKCVSFFHPEAEALVDIRSDGQPLCQRCGGKTMYRQLQGCRRSGAVAAGAAQAGQAIA